MSEWNGFLRKLCDGAGALLMQKFRKLEHITKKGSLGLVTEADESSERYVIGEITARYPDAKIIAEESGVRAGTGELTFIIDPLDGTTNYAFGVPWFCVSIGVYHHKKALAGMIYHPVLQEYFYAEQGEGATLNGEPMRVSTRDLLSDALLGTGFYYSRGPTLTQEVDLFEKMNQVALGVRRSGSAALDLAYVACGRFDAFWERGLSSWDVAAGMLLITEAGGRVSDYRGAATDVFGKEVLATNALLHQECLRLLSLS